MYDDVQTFFQTRSDCDPVQQQLFLEEAARIERNVQPNKATFLDADSLEAREGLITGYKDSRAFKTLLRRQGQVVSRLNRIKENFSKKRQQIQLLSVKPQNKGTAHYPVESTKVTDILSQLRNAHSFQAQTPLSGMVDHFQVAKSTNTTMFHTLMNQSGTANLKPYQIQNSKSTTLTMLPSSNRPATQGSHHRAHSQANYSKKRV